MPTPDQHLGTLLASIAGRLASVNPFRTPPPPPVLAGYPRPVKWRKRPLGNALGHETPRKHYYGSHTMARLGLEGPHQGPGNAARRATRVIPCAT
jgi:hypothetical protein